MSVHFSFVRTDDGVETIVLLGTETRTVPSTHPRYAEIKAALFAGDADEAEVLVLVDEAVKVANALTRLSERVTLRGDNIYFDGDKVESRLTTHIVDMIQAGDDNYSGYVRFLENLAANPSKQSRSELFDFLDKHTLTITDDGCFLGYKAVADDGLSVTAGREDVTVTLADGTMEVHNGRIPNPVGAVVEMPRSVVDGNRDRTCSVGLHVANFRYATNFHYNSKFLTVKVNPRDVVSVPLDSNAEKIRTCRYEVVEENAKRVEYATTSWAPAPVETEVEDDDDFDTAFDVAVEDCNTCGVETDENELDANGDCDSCQYENQYEQDEDESDDEDDDEDVCYNASCDNFGGPVSDCLHSTLD